MIICALTNNALDAAARYQAQLAKRRDEEKEEGHYSGKGLIVTETREEKHHENSSIQFKMDAPASLFVRLPNLRLDSVERKGPSPFVLDS
jgi:hypothetical protein